MLTGDKVETAINIGFSAGLLNDEMKNTIIGADCVEEKIILQYLEPIANLKKEDLKRSTLK